MTSIQDCFADVEDPCIARTRVHPLINIIFIAVCGVLCGADSWTEIEAFGEGKQTWFSKYLDMSHGVPSHDTFGRVFAQIDAEQFQSGFGRWVAGIGQKIEGEIVCIDGKALRGSHDKTVGKEMIEMVSAWATQNKLVLGQRKVDEKSNEITAIPFLLQTLELAGCLVTIDAMGCHKEITKEIVEKKGDYVISLKGNQGYLHQDTIELFAHFEKIGFKGIEHSDTRTTNKGHGRIEIRRCWSIDPSAWADYFRALHQWETIRSLSMVETEREVNGEVTREKRFFIASIPPHAERTLEAVRSHWQIENELHWVLDVAFREDQSRIRTGEASENMAVIRQLAVSLLKQEKSTKLGIHAKRLKCGWDERYLENVLQLSSI